MARIGSERFSFMDPATCGAAALGMDIHGGIRYCTEYARTVGDDEYVCVPYNFS